MFGAVSKRGQDTTSSDRPPVAKARPTNLVMHSKCKDDVSPRSSGSQVNMGLDDVRKSVGLAPGNCGNSNSNFEGGIPKCIDKRRLILPQGNLGRKTKPERKVK